MLEWLPMAIPVVLTVSMLLRALKLNDIADVIELLMLLLLPVMLLVVFGPGSLTVTDIQTLLVMLVLWLVVKFFEKKIEQALA